MHAAARALTLAAALRLLTLTGSAAGQAYTNPVIFGDYSDPDVVRHGDRFYLVASSFQAVPGLPVLESRDLVHWTLVGHAAPRLPSPRYDVPQHGNGLWAPSLRVHDGRFWIYAGDPDVGIYVTTARDPRGPWSPLTLVVAGKGLIDPCPLWDADGRVYLVHAWAKSRAGFNGVLSLRRLSADGLRAIEGDDTGRGTVIFEGGATHPTLEGPKVYRRNGEYFIFAPAGGVTTGWQTVLRAPAVTGPYTARIVMAQGPSPVNGPHQGGWVTGTDGRDWFLHFQDRGPYGRIVHLQPLRWRDDGWPVIGEDPDGDGIGSPVATGPLPVARAARGAIATTDLFEGQLGRQWQWQANPGADWASLSARLGWLRLRPAASRPAGTLWREPRLLLQKIPGVRTTMTARVDIAGARPGDAFWLTAFGVDYSGLRLERTTAGARVTHLTCRDADTGGAEQATATRVVPAATTLWLRLVTGDGAEVRYFVSTDGVTYAPLGEAATLRAGKWIGAKLGIGAVSGRAQPGWFDVDVVQVTVANSR